MKSVVSFILSSSIRVQVDRSSTRGTIFLGISYCCSSFVSFKQRSLLRIAAGAKSPYQVISMCLDTSVVLAVNDSDCVVVLFFICLNFGEI